MPARHPLALAVAALLVLGGAAPPARACGVCIEDKVAATYDHAIVTRAKASGHVVVFAAVDGPVDMKAATDRIAADARRLRGVDTGTVRTSTAPAAVSFALDPSIRSPEQAIATLGKRARSEGVKLEIVKTMRRD